MSDLFKKNRPRLSEDEERALWERVRTIPREAGGRRPAESPRRRPWWEQSPALRFGVPAVAAALVAVVWVMQQQPQAPARQDAMRRSAPVPVPAPAQEAAPPPASTPAPEMQDAAPSRDRAAANESAPAPARVLGGAKDQNVVERRDEQAKEESQSRAQDFRFSQPPPAATSPPSAGGRTPTEALSKEGAAGGVSAGSGTTAAEPKVAATKQRAAAPASPQAVDQFYREKPQTGTLRAVGDDDGSRIAALRAARGDRASAALIGERMLVDVIAPSTTGAFLETVTLPLSGGVARIAATNAPGSLWVEDGGDMRGLVRIAGYEGVTDASSKRRVDAPAAGAAAFVDPSGRALQSRWVPAEGGDSRPLAGPRSTSRSRAAALAAELILALGANDFATVVQVDGAARQLATERPNDPAARALVTWTDDARKAFATAE